MSQENSTKPVRYVNISRRRIGNWKPRIYKRYKRLTDFIEPLGIGLKRFSAWINGHNQPPPDMYELIEKSLDDMGV